MRIFFDDNKKVMGVSNDDSVSLPYPLANQIYCPFVIVNKLDKTVKVSRQKRDSSGNGLFQKPNGEVTKNANILGTDNQPLVEVCDFTRAVCLMDAPGEWTVDDVLNAKYTQLANGKSFWYCEFFDDSAIDLTKSQVSTGFNGASILPKGVLQFNAISFPVEVTELSSYVEAGNDRKQSVKVEVSVDGKIFQPLAAYDDRSNSLIFRLSLPDISDVSTPIHAFAVFY